LPDPAFNITTIEQNAKRPSLSNGPTDREADGEPETDHVFTKHRARTDPSNDEFYNTRKTESKKHKEKQHRTGPRRTFHLARMIILHHRARDCRFPMAFAHAARGKGLQAHHWPMMGGRLNNW